MGFGHRVYKSYYPGAKVLRQRGHEVVDAIGQRDDPLLKLAMGAGNAPPFRVLYLFHRTQVLSQCRFLLRDHFPRAGFPQR